MSDSTGRQPTVAQWVRGWAHSHISNYEVAEAVARRQVEAMTEMPGPVAADDRLTGHAREALEIVLGTSKHEDACSAAASVSRVLRRKSVPDAAAEVASVPVANRMFNEGKQAWGIDVTAPLPPGLVRMIEKFVEKAVSGTEAATLQKVYDKYGADGIRRLYSSR